MRAARIITGLGMSIAKCFLCQLRFAFMQRMVNRQISPGNAIEKLQNINLSQAMGIEMSEQTQLPKPWWQIGLTVLPGLFFLLSASRLLFGTLIVLSLASLWLAFKRRNLFDIPVWGLIPLGWVAFLAVAYIPYNLGFYGIYLLVILISLPFSRKSGLSTGLFLLLGGSFAANFEVEPSIYFWDIPFWRIVISEGGLVLSLIVTPIWVLRSRNIFEQALGLLLPLAAYVATFVYALSRISYIHPERFNFSLSNAISKSGPYIAQFVMLALALVAYGWIASRTLPVNET